MSVTPNSMASTVSVELINEPLRQVIGAMPRKIALVASPLTTKESGLTEFKPYPVYSPESVGALAGFGSAAHRMAVDLFAGSRGLTTYFVPCFESGTAVKAAASMAVSGTATKAGNLYIYDCGKPLAPLGIEVGKTAAQIAALIEAHITGTNWASVTADATDDDVALTAKTGGTFGNGITYTFNKGYGEEFPAGVTVTATAFSAGANDPDVTDVLASFGTGAHVNSMDFTAVLPMVGSTTWIDAIHSYSDDKTSGCSNPQIGRFFRSFYGTVANTLSAITAITDARTTDKTSRTLWVPNSPSHPAMIAARFCGESERAASVNPNESTQDIEIGSILPGPDGQRESDEYAVADAAVQSGVSTTLVKNGVLTIQDAVSFYRPESIPVINNGWRLDRNFAILQNVNRAEMNTWRMDKWKRCTVVLDVAKVTNIKAKARVRDINSVKSQLVANVGQYEGLAWLAGSGPTIEALKQPGAITVRNSGNGFDYTLRLVLSGQMGIVNGTVIFDAAFSSVL